MESEYCETSRSVVKTEVHLLKKDMQLEYRLFLQYNRAETISFLHLNRVVKTFIKCAKNACRQSHIQPRLLQNVHVVKDMKPYTGLLIEALTYAPVFWDIHVFRSFKTWEEFQIISRNYINWYYRELVFEEQNVIPQLDRLVYEPEKAVSIFGKLLKISSNHAYTTTWSPVSVSPVLCLLLMWIRRLAMGVHLLFKGTSVKLDVHFSVTSLTITPNVHYQYKFDEFSLHLKPQPTYTMFMYTPYVYIRSIRGPRYESMVAPAMVIPQELATNHPWT